MTVKAIMPERVLNPVEPLGHKPTAMRATETFALQGELWSDAVSPLIGESLRSGDMDSPTKRRTPRTTPSPRTSRTATRTGTTRTTTGEFVPSADSLRHPAEGGTPFSMPDLVQAWQDCRRHKRSSSSALAFEQDVEHELCLLRDELLRQTYRPGRSICFVITHPKPREVWAAQFRDRVVHHLLYNAIGERFERAFIANSSACIKGRGTLYAAERLEHDVRSITQNWSRRAFYLKCDLANFFVSIDKRVLLQRLHARVHEPFWRWLTETVLMHDPQTDFEVRGNPALLASVPLHKQLMHAPADTGLPIGNLSSQFFANVLLDGLDQHVKHRLQHAGGRHYGRYVDDFYLLHESPQRLNEALASIDAHVRESLHCALNPRKTILQPIDRGIDFVGQVIKPWRRVPRPRTVQTAMARLSAMPAAELFSAGNSYLGLIGQAPQGHSERARVARLLCKRGHAVSGDLSKIYRARKPAC